mmetsp:Transcript_24435/g.39679  ORF Transcript_24435/g.39679 Transcript_24435/m.39679 type:complete len:514 (-) Transcript_24435:584-2125(-)
MNAPRLQSIARRLHTLNPVKEHSIREISVAPKLKLEVLEDNQLVKKLRHDIDCINGTTVRIRDSFQWVHKTRIPALRPSRRIFGVMERNQLQKGCISQAIRRFGGDLSSRVYSRPGQLARLLNQEKIVYDKVTPEGRHVTVECYEASGSTCGEEKIGCARVDNQFVSGMKRAKAWAYLDALKTVVKRAKVAYSDYDDRLPTSLYEQLDPAVYLEAPIFDLDTEEYKCRLHLCSLDGVKTWTEVGESPETCLNRIRVAARKHVTGTTSRRKTLEDALIGLLSTGPIYMFESVKNEDYGVKKVVLGDILSDSVVHTATGPTELECMGTIINRQKDACHNVKQVGLSEPGDTEIDEEKQQIALEEIKKTDRTSQSEPMTFRCETGRARSRLLSLENSLFKGCSVSRDRISKANLMTTKASWVTLGSEEQQQAIVRAYKPIDFLEGGEPLFSGFDTTGLSQTDWLLGYKVVKQKDFAPRSLRIRLPKSLRMKSGGGFAVTCARGGFSVMQVTDVRTK